MYVANVIEIGQNTYMYSNRAATLIHYLQKKKVMLQKEIIYL